MLDPIISVFRLNCSKDSDGYKDCLSHYAAALWTYKMFSLCHGNAVLHNYQQGYVALQHDTMEIYMVGTV